MAWKCLIILQLIWKLAKLTERVMISIGMWALESLTDFYLCLFLQLRYQHGLSTPDLRQTLPNLKNFMELGLMVRW